MRIIKTRGYCQHCDKYVLAEKEGVNHLIHLIMSFLTCWIWAGYWLFAISINRWKPYRCSRCGCPVE